MPVKDYQKAWKIRRNASLLKSLSQLMNWDQETYMPSKGITLKVEQNQWLEESVHKMLTSSPYIKALSKLIDLDSGKVLQECSPEIQASLGEMKRDYDQTHKIPTSFVKSWAKVTTNSLEAWKTAKSQNTFKTFSPHLKKIVALLQKKAQYLGYKDHPYDALLDLYEPGLTTKDVENTFNPLKKELLSLVKQVSQKKDSRLLAQKNAFCLENQKKLSHNVIQKMGMPKDCYNLAETAHPFCSGLSPQDIRITSHFYTDDFTKGFFATVHETGHALYEQGLRWEEFGSPLGEACSFAVHESQSRIWEVCIGQSDGFWQYFYPKCQEYFPEILGKTSLESWMQEILHVEPSFIRIYADELTYNLHIILRFEIEKKLLEESLDVKDVPEMWNSLMQEYLGITPPSFAQGCLQDVHWSLGYLGYFPSYTLGNIYAGNLFPQIQKEHPDWNARFAKGDFLFAKDFLAKHIYQHGRRYLPQELIEKACDHPVSLNPYLSYLQKKYLKKSSI